MSIQKTDKGKWRVRVDIGRDSRGMRVRKSKVVPTKREAEALEHMWSDMARTDAIVRDVITFADFVEEIYIPLKKGAVRKSTMKAYMRDIRNYLLPAFGYMRMDRISHQAIQHMLDHCPSYKAATNARDTLRQILNEAKARNYLNQNPATDTFTMPARKLYPEDHNGDWLTEFEQHWEFIERIDNELFKTMSVVGLSFGLRKGEIFGLDWEDIDFERRCIHVQRTYVSEEGGMRLMPPKTRKSDRIVPMHKVAYEYLSELYSRRGEPTGAVCTNYHGERANPNRTAARWRTYLEKRDLPRVTILNMRHSFATACINRHMDIAKVSKMLGHTQVSTTMNRYVRMKDKDILDGFDAYFSD